MVTRVPSNAWVEGLAEDKVGSREGASVAPGWGREKAVGFSWLEDFFQGLDPGAGTGGRGLVTDQWIFLHVT